MTVSILFKATGQVYDHESWETKVEQVFAHQPNAQHELLTHGVPDNDGCVRTADEYRNVTVWWIETHEVK